MKKILAFLKKLFLRSQYWIKKAVIPSIQIVDGLKWLVNSPTIPFITAIIPGHFDDLLVEKAKEVLPKVLKILRITDECISLENPDEVLKCIVSKLKTFDDESKAVAYHNVATLLSHYLSDKKITWSEAIHLAEAVYTKQI